MTGCSIYKSPKKNLEYHLLRTHNIDNKIELHRNMRTNKHVGVIIVIIS